MQIVFSSLVDNEHGRVPSGHYLVYESTLMELRKENSLLTPQKITLSKLNISTGSIGATSMQVDILS